MSIRSLAAPAWVLLALFVVYASSGTWTSDGPGMWAPTYLSWADLAQNALLYLPFGVFGVLTLRHRRQSPAASALEITGIALLFSLFVEVIQLHTVERVASLTDVIAAAIGAVAGGLIAEPAARAGDRAVGAAKPSGVFDSPNAPVWFALLGAIIVVAWWPFEPTLDVSSLTMRARTVRDDPWQFDAALAAAQALCYLCLSLAIARSAYRLSTWEAMLAGTAAAGVVALVADVGQFAMGSQPIGLAAVGAQMAGAVCGSALFGLGRLPK